MGRRFTNSLQIYIESIKESTDPTLFSTEIDKFNIQYNATRIDQLEHDYLKFWAKNQYYPREIEKEKDVLNLYSLKFKHISGKKANIFANVRWKNAEEDNDMLLSHATPLAQFLTENWK
jgi:hypothetical protein